MRLTTFNTSETRPSQYDHTQRKEFHRLLQGEKKPYVYFCTWLQWLFPELGGHLLFSSELQTTFNA